MIATLYNLYSFFSFFLRCGHRGPCPLVTRLTDYLKNDVHYDLRKYYFGNRIVLKWNSLPDNIIISSTIGVFENRLDRFWNKQTCKAPT